MSSPFFKLNVRDVIKGIVVAVLTAILMGLQRLLEAHGFALTMDDLKTISASGLASGIGYILKQLLTDEQDKLGGVI